MFAETLQGDALPFRLLLKPLEGSLVELEAQGPGLPVDGSRAEARDGGRDTVVGELRLVVATGQGDEVRQSNAISRRLLLESPPTERVECQLDLSGRGHAARLSSVLVGTLSFDPQP